MENKGHKHDFAKLDHSFICNIQADKGKQDYVQELISVFHNRGIQVIAESIETKEELGYLQQNTEADYYQGYYLGMPAYEYLISNKQNMNYKV